MPIKFRQASQSDSQPIAQLIEALAKQFIIHEFSEKGQQQFLRSNNQKAIEKFFEQGFIYHVAELDNQIIAVIGIRDNSHIYHLFVDHAYQGQGLSKQLWQIAKTKSIQVANPEKFSVNSSNYAVPVYESLGFKKVGDMQESHGVLFNPMVLNVKC
jgi:GNAT superfamily N-acetyltransferase